MMSSASCLRAARPSEKLSRSFARGMPSTGIRSLCAARTSVSSRLDSTAAARTRTVSKLTTVRAARSTRMPAAFAVAAMALALDVDRDPRGCDRGELQHVPVGEVDAAMGLDAADESGLRRAVDAIVRHVEPHPHHAYGVVGPGSDLRLRVLRIVVVQLGRIEIEHRVLHLAHDLELARRQLVARSGHAD